MAQTTTTIPNEETAVPRNGESAQQPRDSNKDVALTIVDANHSTPLDPAMEARIVRKIDVFLMPVMLIGYGLVYYDKAILGSAALFGMTTDLSLSITNTTTHTTSTSRLSWATSLFYFGMLAGLYPLTFLSQRTGVNMNRYLSLLVCTWSLICMLTATVTSWRGLYVQRFFLGFVESVIPTTFMCIISSFYTQREQSFRHSIWFSSTGLFTIIGGALNYGFAQTHGNLKSWQYIYLFAGTITFVYGLACLGIPGDPTNAWFLGKTERVVAVERLRRGQMGVRAGFKKYQVIEAFFDIKIWLVAVMMASAYTVNGAISGFGPLIVSTFGYSTLDAILFQFPLGGICFVFILLTGYLSSRIPSIRIMLLVACCLPVIAGCAMIWKSAWINHAAVPVIGYSITGFFGPVVSLIIGIGMANVAGYTKRCVMAATTFVAYAVGNIVGPQLIKSQTKAFHYPELWKGLIICYCITIASSLALYFVLWKENKRRDMLDLDENEANKVAFNDWTDKENLHFRYVL